MRIAFIGTGVMGTPMIKNLVEAGHEVSVFNRTKEHALNAQKAGGELKESLAEAVKDAEVVITMVGFPSDVEEIYFGPNNIIENAADGALLIDMTTTDPNLSEKIYKAAAKKDLKALDAPVSGGDIGAQNGTLSIMVGGDEDVYNEALPIFQILGKDVRYMGEAGSGQHTKMANQIAIAGALAGVCEALNYAKAAGLNPNEVIEAIKGGAAGSWQLTNLGPKMLKEDFNPGFYIKHMKKDLKIASEQAHLKNQNIETAETVLSHFEDLEKDELGTQALYLYYK